MKVKKGDNVIVCAGNNKGKKGTVMAVDATRNTVVIEGVNMRKKHKKPTRRDEKGTIVSIAMPLNVSNVALIDPKKNIPTRIGYIMRDGKKVRIARKSGQEI
jgi:large subunit ribosomal protein L24